MAQTDTQSASDLSELDSNLFNEEDDGNEPSDTASSSASPSPNPFGTLSSKKGPEIRRKLTWEHSRKPFAWEDVRNKKSQRIFYCRHCNWFNLIQNADQHLQKKHDIIIYEAPSLRKQAQKNALKAAFGVQQQKAQETMDQKVVNIMKSGFNKALYEEALARLIARGSLPHRLIELPEWTIMISAVNWTVIDQINTSHSTIPPRIKGQFQVERQLVKEHLHNSISCIHLSTDSWYAGRTLQKDYQGINAIWVDSNGVINTALLALPALYHGHGGNQVAPHLIETLQFYDIEHRLGWITGDNHGANDTLCRDIEEHLITKGITGWSAAHQRLRCFGHIVNLIAHAFLYCDNAEAVDIALQRAANSGHTIDESLYLYGSIDDGGWSNVATLKKIDKFAALLTKQRHFRVWQTHSSKRLTRPNDTRWHGWFTLIDQVLTARPAYAAVCNEVPELEEYLPSSEEWLLLQYTYQILQPLKEVCKRAEGNNTTLDLVQLEMDFLRHQLERLETKHGGNPSLLASINTMWLLFNKYYEKIDEIPAYVTAILLHPSRRKAYLIRNWKPAWIRPGIARAKGLWSEYQARYPTAQPLDELSDSYGKEPSDFELFRRQMDVVPTGDDFDTFINAPPTKLATGSSPISWWSSPDQRAAYPALSRLAIDVLSACPMSALTERTFSSVRRTTSWERTRLGDDVIEQSECCKDWQSSGLAYAPLTPMQGVQYSAEGDDEVLEAPPATTP